MRGRIVATVGVPVGAVVAALLAACGPGPRDTTAATRTPEQPPPFVATQRAPSGGTLIFIDTAGATVADFIEPGHNQAIDSSPAWSPDGDWIVFVSTRARSLAETSLWIARAEPRATPRRLTVTDTIENHPTFSPDGRWLVYASREPDGSFDLYRAALLHEDGVPRLGNPTRLTEESGQELRPTVSPDGQRIAYMHIDARMESRIRVIPWAGGAPTDLTEGPADVTPAWSPDGRTIAYATRPGTRLDTDLYLLDLETGERRPAVDEPLADQTGPVWSADGRYLVCTSVFRSAQGGAPLTSSITLVDLRQSEPVLIALHDPSAVENRAGPAIAPRILDATAVHQNPTYADALADWTRQVLRERPELVDELPE
jgi:Tol biopolymer transport system component